MPNTRVGEIHEKTRDGRAERDFTFDSSEHNQIHKISRPNRQTLRILLEILLLSLAEETAGTGAGILRGPTFIIIEVLQNFTNFPGN